MKRSNQTLPIEFVHPLGADLYHMRLTFDAPAPPFQAGQFAELSQDKLILPRPFSIFAQDSTGIEFLILKKGPGSSAFVEVPLGTKLRCTFPLGTGFAPKAWPQSPKTDRPWLLVGGGVGIAPMIAAWRELQQAGLPAQALFGFRGEEAVKSAKKIIPEGMACQFSTDDGSWGLEGFVSKLLETSIAHSTPAGVLICGPDPMMDACAQLCLKGSVPAFLSMETYMGCGVGICSGCAVKMKGGRYKLACQDGPVFDLSHLDY
jgi:dihydroorotate dehydrogenase electron transfer subunit